MGKQKLVSVIIPIYNVAQYVEKCIDSIIDQTYTNIEIIMVNDGSTDNSGDIIKKYCSDIRCKILNKENGGASSARNMGLENAKGEYIYFVDSDDYLQKNAISLLVDKMDESHADFCCFRIYFYTGDGKTKFVHGNDFHFDVLDNKNEIIKDALLGINIKSTTWSKFFLRSFIEKNHLRFENGIVNEDCLHTITSAIYSHKVAFLNIPLYHALIRQGSVSRGIKKELLTSYFVVHEKTRVLLEKEEIFSKYEKYFYIGYYKNILNILLQSAMKVSQKNIFIDLYDELNGTLYFDKKYAKYFRSNMIYYCIYILSLNKSLFYIFAKFYRLINCRRTY